MDSHSAYVALSRHRTGVDLHYGRDDFKDQSRSEEHTSELQSLMRISYAVFCLKKKISHLWVSNNKFISPPLDPLIHKLNLSNSQVHPAQTSTHYDTYTL